MLECFVNEEKVGAEAIALVLLQSDQIALSAASPLDLNPVHNHGLFAARIIAIVGKESLPGDVVRVPISIDVRRLQGVGLRKRFVDQMVSKLGVLLATEILKPPDTIVVGRTHDDILIPVQIQIVREQVRCP